jgi:hypothetical protein
MSSTGGHDSAGSAERRQQERISILGALHAEVLVLQPMQVREISRAGVQVETTFPFQLDSLHELRLVLGERAVVVKGRITHCSLVDVDQDAVRYRTGIQFAGSPKHVHRALGAFIDALKTGRRAAI